MATAVAGTPTTGDDKPAADKPAADKPAGDKPVADKPAADKPAADKPAADKPAADKPGDQQAAEPGGKAGDAQKPKAPEKYALTLPEGTRLDATDVAAVEQLAKANDWTNEDAQAELVERSTAFDAIAARFLAETTADPDYGGDKLADTQRLANLALDRLQPKGTPRGDRTRAMLAKTGYGNHIAFVALMADVGKLMAEDSPIVGRAAAPEVKKDPAAVLYPGMVEAKP
jgi:hypothetical protein